MKKIVLVFTVLIALCAYAQVDYTQLKADRESCYKVQTSQCFLKLVNKYSMATSDWKNVLYFDYSNMLLVEKNYSKAKEGFKTVLFREKNNKKLIDAAQQKINEIDELYRKIATANNLDAGNYFDENDKNFYWQKPYNIKVYIASNTGKEDILKKALYIWDEKLFKSVNFSYVQDSKDANIIIKYVDGLSGTTAGVTKYIKTYTIGKKNYMQQITIDVALSNPSGGKYTDTNLLSIALHEIGHGLGISYHSKNLNDIMYYSTETYKNVNISRRDVNTVERLYR